MNSCEWKIQHDLVAYAEAHYWMEKRVFALQKGEAPECVWFLEHPSLYTLGTSAKEKDVLPSATFPTFRTERGGQVTYHGPGQRVIYLMLDLKTRKQDLHWYINTLEEWLIQTLKHFGVKGERRLGRVGIWVNKEGRDYKIAALGVRVQKWVTSHGVALNVKPDLSAYKNIVPCGLSQYGVTSMADLGLSVTLSEMDKVLKSTFPFSPCAS